MFELYLVAIGLFIGACLMIWLNEEMNRARRLGFDEGFERASSNGLPPVLRIVRPEIEPAKEGVEE